MLPVCQQHLSWDSRTAAKLEHCSWGGAGSQGSNEMCWNKFVLAVSYSCRLLNMSLCMHVRTSITWLTERHTSIHMEVEGLNNSQTPVINFSYVPESCSYRHTTSFPNRAVWRAYKKNGKTTLTLVKTTNYFLPHFNVPQCCIITYPGIGRLSRSYKGVIFHILLCVGY